MVAEFETYLAIVPNSPEESVLRLLIELGLSVSGGQEGSLLAYDKAGNDLVFAMTVGGSEILIGQRVPMNEGITGLAAATREVQVGAPTYHNVQQTQGRGAGPESVIAAPMLVNDELIGVITTVTFEQGKRFTGKDADFYAKVAAIAGVVVGQRRSLKTAGEVATSTSAEARIARSLSAILRARPESARHLETLLGTVAELIAVRAT